MAEEQKSIKAETPTPTVTSDIMKTQGADANQFKQAFTQRQNEFQNTINSAFDNSFNAQKQGLQNAYEQNLAGQTQATNAGQQAFDFAKEDLTTQAGRTQRDMNSYADVRGLNRQPGSQQALSLGLAASTAAGRLAQQQQMALEESERQKAMLSTDYNNRVQAAIADRDYKRAAALLDDYNNQNTWLDQNAAQMANFGNFTGYEQIYGPNTAEAMRYFWIGSNPELAYNTGVIDEARYKEITHRTAPGAYSGGGGGGSSGGSGGGGGGGGGSYSGGGGGGGVTPH